MTENAVTEEVVWKRRDLLAGCFAGAFLRDDRGDALTHRIRVLSNVERHRNGVALLRSNPQLDAAACKIAEACLAEGALSHEAGGTTLSQRVREAGYPYHSIGENLHWSRGRSLDGLPRLFVRGWMESPSHRENLLNVEFREIGVAALKDGADVVAAQVLGVTRSSEW